LPGKYWKANSKWDVIHIFKLPFYTTAAAAHGAAYSTCRKLSQQHYETGLSYFVNNGVINLDAIRDGLNYSPMASFETHKDQLLAWVRDVGAQRILNSQGNLTWSERTFTT